MANQTLNSQGHSAVLCCKKLEVFDGCMYWRIMPFISSVNYQSSQLINSSSDIINLIRNGGARTIKVAHFGREFDMSILSHDVVPVRDNGI